MTPRIFRINDKIKILSRKEEKILRYRKQFKNDGHERKQLLNDAKVGINTQKGVPMDLKFIATTIFQ